MKWIYNDGGRKAAGYKGDAGDCVVRAIAIATGLPYDEVYKAVAECNASSRSRCKSAGKKSARNGVDTRSAGFRRYMESIGWKWTPTMHIGQGCKVHLTDSELPAGNLIVAVSRHYTCVVNGVIHDTFDPQRGETQYMKTVAGVTTFSSSPDRCVYGYWSKENAQ